MANTTNQVPGFAEERARLIVHDGPDPGRHRSGGKRVWLITGLGITAALLLVWGLLHLLTPEYHTYYVADGVAYRLTDTLVEAVPEGFLPVGSVRYFDVQDKDEVVTISQAVSARAGANVLYLNPEVPSKGYYSRPNGGYLVVRRSKLPRS